MTATVEPLSFANEARTPVFVLTLKVQTPGRCHP
jgi:hypothetical protein